MSTVLDGLYYSESHEWLKVEGEFGYIGITDYAQHQLGNVVYVDLPWRLTINWKTSPNY